jgi:hypothetical protein
MFRDIRHKLVQELKALTVADLARVGLSEAGGKGREKEKGRKVKGKR